MVTCARPPCLGSRAAVKACNGALGTSPTAGGTHRVLPACTTSCVDGQPHLAERRPHFVGDVEKACFLPLGVHAQPYCVDTGSSEWTVRVVQQKRQRRRRRPALLPMLPSRAASFKNHLQVCPPPPRAPVAQWRRRSAPTVLTPGHRRQRGVQYSTVLYSALQYSTVLCGTLQYSTVL
jgi:hypothetical protein